MGTHLVMKCTNCNGTGYKTDPGGKIPWKCGRCMTTGLEPSHKQLCINEMTREIASITLSIEEGDHFDNEKGVSYLPELIQDRRFYRKVLKSVSDEATDEMSFEEVKSIVGKIERYE